jgi:hypothetical protein
MLCGAVPLAGAVGAWARLRQAPTAQIPDLGTAAYRCGSNMCYVTSLKPWVVVLVTVLLRRATVLLNHDTS